MRRRLRNSMGRRVGGRSRQLLSALFICLAFAALVGVGYGAGSVTPASGDYGYQYSTTTTTTSSTSTSTGGGGGGTADLQLSMNAPSTVRSGSTLSYVIFLQNAGPAAAQNVSITDHLPFGTVFSSITKQDNTWVCTTPKPGATGTVTCSKSSLAAGQGAVTAIAVKVKARPSKGGTVLVNQATVTSSTPDPNTANNTASASTAVTK